MDLTDFYNGGSLIFMILILMVTAIIPLLIGSLLILFLILGHLFFKFIKVSRY